MYPPYNQRKALALVLLRRKKISSSKEKTPSKLNLLDISWQICAFLAMSQWGLKYVSKS